MNEKTIFKKSISFEEARQLLEQMRRDRGFPSGYPALDQLCGGLVKNGVTLIGARPAMGKTSLVLNIVSRLSKELDGTILIFSPKTWTQGITMQLLSISTNLAAENLLNNQVSPVDIADKFLDYFFAKVSNIQIDSSALLDLEDIQDQCDSIPDLRMVVIDPVNAICKPMDYSAEPGSWGEKESNEVIFQSLQELAHNLNVPVLCTTYLHRNLEKRPNKRPRLADLKKIGIPAELVDQVIFLYRDQYYDPEGEDGAEWIVAKVAQGEPGTIRLGWDDETKRFDEK